MPLNKKGSNLILVIVFLMLFMIMVIAVSAVATFGFKSGVVQRNYSQAYYAAKTINIGIADAINSEKGLSLTNTWINEFDIKSYVLELIDEDTNEVIDVIIDPSKGPLLKSYTNGTHGADDNLNNNIKVNNKITLEYIVVDTITYKALITVKTTATHSNQSYTQTAELENYYTIDGQSDDEEVGYEFENDYLTKITNNKIYEFDRNGSPVGNPNGKGVNTVNVISTSENIIFYEAGSTVNTDVISGKNIDISGARNIIKGNIVAINEVRSVGGGVEAHKNIISLNGIYIMGTYGADIRNSIITKGDVKISGGNNKVGLDIISLGSVTSAETGVAGNVIAQGPISMHLSSQRKVGGNIYSSSNITISQGEVNGNIISMGDVILNDNVTVKGNIIANGNVTMPNKGSVKNIYSNGKVTLNQVAVDGEIRAKGSVSMPNGGSANNIYSNGDVSLTQVAVDGEIRAKGNVTMPNKGSVNSIFSNGDVSLTQVAVSGNIYADGSVTSGNNYNTTIKGSIYSNSNVSLTGGTVDLDIVSLENVNLVNVAVKGNIQANGNVTMPNGGTVELDIVSLGNLDLKNVTVKGNITSNGTVILEGGAAKNINSNEAVSLTRVTVNEDIVATGNIKMSSGGSANNIKSNGTVEIIGTTVYKDVRAYGKITSADWQANVYGGVYSNSTIDDKVKCSIKESLLNEEYPIFFSISALSPVDIILAPIHFNIDTTDVNALINNKINEIPNIIRIQDPSGPKPSGDWSIIFK